MKISFGRLYLSLFVALFLFGATGTTFAQTADGTGQSTINIKNSFFGHWKSDRDPNSFLDIYKDGELIIVQRGSLLKQAGDRNRFVVTYEKGNRITVDLGTGLSPLTLSDDGAKVSFLGDTYNKK